MTKKSFHQEDAAIINVSEPRNRAPGYIRQTLTKLKGERDISTIAGDVNSTLSIMDKRPGLKMNKQTQDLIVTPSVPERRAPTRLHRRGRTAAPGLHTHLLEHTRDVPQDKVLDQKPHLRALKSHSALPHAKVKGN